jgi:general stress protein 26
LRKLRPTASGTFAVSPCSVLLGYLKGDPNVTTPQAMEEKFWEALRSDMTLMLGLNGVKDGHTRPMTAQLDGNGDRGPIWFFTVKDTLLAKDLENGNRAIATFVSKNHDVFATIHGALSVDSDRATIDRLWNSHVAAWYESGKDDPALMLLRLDAETAEIWLDASSFVAGVKALFGVDPKKDYKDNMAKVSFP